MAQGKITSILQKVTSILTSDGNLSNLERDLVKEYLRQLYDLVDDFSTSSLEQAPPLVKQTPQVALSFLDKPEAQQSFPLDTSTHKSEQRTLREDPHGRDFTAQGADSSTLWSEDKVVPEQNTEASADQKEVDLKHELKNDDLEAPVAEAREIKDPYEQTVQKYNGHPPASEAPVEAHKPTPVTTEIKEMILAREHVPARYQELFQTEQSTELSQRLGRLPISDLRKALGINDRLLIINDLFGGDGEKYNETLDILNSKYSFEEAKSYMIRYLIDQYGWLEEEKQVRAREFIKLVERRFL